MELLHVEVSEFLRQTEKKIVTEDDPVKEVVQRQIIEMKDVLKMERNEYEVTQSDFSLYSRHYAGCSFCILIYFSFADAAFTTYKG
jgi:1-phosphatidylinositol-3-phosphate 5-kinase